MEHEQTKKIDKKLCNANWEIHFCTGTVSCQLFAFFLTLEFFRSCLQGTFFRASCFWGMKCKQLTKEHNIIHQKKYNYHRFLG